MSVDRPRPATTRDAMDELRMALRAFGTALLETAPGRFVRWTAGRIAKGEPAP